MELGSEDRDLADNAPVIQKLGAPSIAQIEKLIGQLQEAKNLLESEGERIQREMARYIKFTQLASASVKIIFETVSEWRQEGHPMRKFVSRRMAGSFDSAPEA